MIEGIFLGIKSFFKSLSAISKYGLWTYALSTGILGIAVAYGIYKLIWTQSNSIGDWLSSFYRWEWGSDFVSSASDWIILSLLFVVCFMIYKYIILILSAPIMSLMSEKIELFESAQSSPKFSFSEAVKSMIRGLRIAIRNLSWEIFLTIIFFVLGLFPIFGLVSAVLIFLVQAYYAGFGSMDFYMERHFSVKESVFFVRRNKGLALVIGSIFLGLLAIPLLGAFLAPILSAITATLAVHPKISANELQFS